ncbi:sigma-54 dependent transcriptional regulator [Alteromonas sp. 1_MG-2023]|uniref:sigma-54-dependent transcriptional regulator n=1 Tax=Alteromonas sp. 1_MG-2023 TaxID=3062669 RepID=UPI0026E439F3|nr:sigma-54 dependent transcriptional regulator [Alteromonas sp. 1_MG-2023]MDO6474099.1 sigma-54 dependent transcriptional regulator [Alteromonas sp. 1_MG-2023]
MSALKVMIVDDEKHVRESLQQTLALEDFEIEACESAHDALQRIEANWDGIVITDINMPNMNGVELLERIQAVDSDIPVIVLTGHGNVSLAVEAMRIGAYDFLEKPFSVDVLIETVHRAVEKRTLTLENRSLRRELEASELPGPRIIGRHPAVVRMRALLDKVKDTPADVLINGETGTGKELVARYLHHHSQRRQKPFVAINCGALPETIIESELFGHEPGAFTGANKKRVGKFEYANGGTLMLDEIESMPLNLQTKLLRVLEERKVEPLGSNKQIPLDIRIIAATKEDLRELADKGEFRSDLYYRLNVIQVDIPALRNRKSDIPLLFEHFMAMAAYRYGSEMPSLSEAHAHALANNDWPGNVRELRNVADCFTLLGESRAFGQLAGTNDFTGGQLTLTEQMDHFEESVIRTSLNAHNGVLKDVQASLGIGRKTLYEKMKKFDIDKSQFKQ